MRVTVPDYYKDFKCIAGKCEDTCCAGWEVDVDEESFLYYKQVKGSLGKRLREVMIPKAEGEGCSFRLTPDKRCPFLNKKNLCDIYAELGEDALCETCTYFPRFVHDYGSVREIGTAPSCFTAAQLMVNKAEKTELVTFDDKNIAIRPNDICPEAFFMLKDLRDEFFCILWDDKLPLHKRLKCIIDKANAIQPELCDLLDTEPIIKVNGADNQENIVASWLEPFEGMEIINKDWSVLVEEYKDFCDLSEREKTACFRRFEKNSAFSEYAFLQLLFYYFYRYVLEAVHDGRLLCAVKTGIVAYICTRELCVARFTKKGRLSGDEAADIFHLYSRQIEHSDVNFEHYRWAYDNDRNYSAHTLIKLLDKSYGSQ